MNFLRNNRYDITALLLMAFVVSVVLYNPAWLHWKSVWMTAAVLSAVAWVNLGYVMYQERKNKTAVTGSYAHEIGAADRVDVHRPIVVEDQKDGRERSFSNNQENEREMFMDDDDDGAAGPTPLGR